MIMKKQLGMKLNELGMNYSIYHFKNQDKKLSRNSKQTLQNLKISWRR